MRVLNLILKKLISFAAAAVMTAAAVYISPAELTMSASANTLEDKEFIVGFDAEFPPYGYKDDNGEYVGFDLDLAQEVCDRNGWTLKKQPIEWNSKDMELKNGTIDCLWNGFTMNGRESKYTWSVPYVDNSQVVIVKDNSGINELDDLAGKIVAVQADSSALAALTGEDATEENLALAESFKDLQQVGDYNSAFMNLDSGAVDAIAMDIGVASYEMNSRGGGFKMLDDHLSAEEYGVGFLLGNTELRDAVQNTLFDMLDDGTFEKIAKDWGLEESVCLSRDEVTENGNVSDSAVAKDKKPGFGEKICQHILAAAPRSAGFGTDIRAYDNPFDAAWSAGNGGQDVEIRSPALADKALHIHSARHAAYAAAAGSILRPLLPIQCAHPA